ncbi:MAG: C25 family cysteine peptidase [Candidatus Thermoplasmatota archaeon]|nr:C25 family cysteine peptidase [Candidatus Thermoplasmatota archaeon]
MKLKKLVAVIIIISIIVASAYYLLAYAKKPSFEDLLNSRSERKLGSTTIIVSNMSYFALIGTPVALYYDREEKLLSPLVVEGEQSDNFLAIFSPESSFRLEGEAESASIAAAERFWKSSDGAIILQPQAYEIALTIAPLASYLNIPVLVTENVNNIVPTLKALNVKYTVVCGELSGYGKSWKLNSIQEAQELLLDFMYKRFGSFNYIVLTNPKDTHSEHGLSKISCLAPYLAAGRTGIVVASSHERLPEDAFVNFKEREEEIAAMANNITVKIKVDLNNVLNKTKKFEKFFQSYLENPYIAILGCPYSIPFYYKYVDIGDDKKWIATDDYYSNLDENEFTVELASGRPIALSLSATSCLLSRSLCYDKYKENYNEGAGATTTNNLANTEWKSAGYVGSGDDWNGAIWMMRPEHARAHRYLLQNDYFVYTTKRRLSGETVAQDILKLYTSSSMIYVMAHGSPSGYNMVDSIEGEDVQEWGLLGPSVLILISCSAGRIDVEDIDKTISLSFMSVGTNAYIAGTRTEWTEGSPEISFYCLRSLVSEDAAVGIAFRDAKNYFVKEYVETGKLDYYHAGIKQLYAEPAFNPYTPNIEG